MKRRFYFTAMFLASAIHASACSQGSGSISTAAYIGIEEAKEAALKSADISPEQAVFSTAGLDSRDGISFYQVNFTANGTDYEYAVDALTGIVIQELCLAEGSADAPTWGESGSSGQSDVGNPSVQSGGGAPSVQPGGGAPSVQPGEDAPSVQSGGDAPSVQSGGGAPSSQSGGGAPSSQSGGDAPSGYPGGGSPSSRTEQSSNPAAPPSSAAVQNSVDAGAAGEIALAHAGISKDSVRQMETKQDSDDGIVFYKVKFYSSDGTKYKYEIDASTGSVLAFDRDLPEEDGGHHGGSNSQSLIGEAAAKQAVLARVPGAGAGAVSLSLDEDNGRMEYEGELI